MSPRRRYYRVDKGTGEVREKVKEVFKVLRKHGFIARMNFLCCSTCASYELGERLNTSCDKKFVAYWHNQDEERYRETGHLHIRYFSKEGESIKEAGKDIIMLLKLAGVVYRWDGNTRRTIEVFETQELLDDLEKREREWKEQANA